MLFRSISRAYGQRTVPGSRKDRSGKRWFSEPSNNELGVSTTVNMTIILPTTPEVGFVCDELEMAIKRFLDARSSLPPLGRYESQVEAINLFYLALRDIEGVYTLARSDLILIPPAMASARAGFEAAVKAMWMVDADDPFECEGRWLAHLKAEERFHSRIAARYSEIAKDARHARERVKSIASFSQAVQEKLPPGITVLNGNPSVDKMLEATGVDHQYAAYIYLSQFAHAEHAATWLYRARGLGVEMLLGDFTKPSDWHVPLGVAWFALVHSGRVLLKRLGGDPDLFIRKDHEERIVKVINNIGSNDSAQESSQRDRPTSRSRRRGQGFGSRP